MYEGKVIDHFNTRTDLREIKPGSERDLFLHDSPLLEIATRLYNTALDYNLRYIRQHGIKSVTINGYKIFFRSPMGFGFHETVPGNPKKLAEFKAKKEEMKRQFLYAVEHGEKPPERKKVDKRKVSTKGIPKTKPKTSEQVAAILDGDCPLDVGMREMLMHEFVYDRMLKKVFSEINKKGKEEINLDTMVPINYHKLMKEHGFSQIYQNIVKLVCGDFKHNYLQKKEWLDRFREYTQKKRSEKDIKEFLKKEPGLPRKKSLRIRKVYRDGMDVTPVEEPKEKAKKNRKKRSEAPFLDIGKECLEVRGGWIYIEKGFGKNKRTILPPIKFHKKDWELYRKIEEENKAKIKKIMEEESLSESEARKKAGVKNILLGVRFYRKKGRHYYAIIVKRPPPPAADAEKNRVAGIDFGLNNIAAVTPLVEGVTPLLVVSRNYVGMLKKIDELLDYYQSLMENSREFKNLQRKVQKINDEIDEENKGKPDGEKKKKRKPPKPRYSKRMLEIYEMRDKLKKEYNHCVANIVRDYLARNNIGRVAFGHNELWKESIAKKNDKAVEKKEIKRKEAKKKNRKFNGVPHDKLKFNIKYRLDEIGIKVKKQEESYTSIVDLYSLEDLSKKSGFWGKRDKDNYDFFYTKVGEKVWADIMAGGNIARKAFPEIEFNPDNLVRKPEVAVVDLEIMKWFDKEREKMFKVIDRHKRIHEIKKERKEEVFV